MSSQPYHVNPIGIIHSPLTSRADAPLQGDEGTTAAWLSIDDAFKQGLEGISVGDQLIVLTWLHLGQREVLAVRPRGRADAPLTGVFATRSPDRPNPIGLHRVTVIDVAAGQLKVSPLEAIDGTPIIDIKPVLADIHER